MDKGSPCPIPLSTFIHSDIKLLNLSLVCLLVNSRSMKWTYSSGICHMHKLCNRQDETAFRKGPSTSRNRTATMLCRLQAALIQWTSKCMVSVVQQPGCPPKWWSGSKECCLHMYTKSSAKIADSNLPMVFINAIGQCAFRIS